MQLSRIIGLALLTTAIIGCDDDDPVEPDSDLAAVVIANTAFATSDVDVEIEGFATPLAVDLDFGFAATQCVLVPAEEEITFTMSTGDDELASETVALEDGQTYTILLTSSGTSEHIVVLEDDISVEDGDRALRFVNATGAEGDVYLFAEGGAMGTPVVEDLAYTGTAVTAPQYMVVDEDLIEVRFFDPGVSTGTPRSAEQIPTGDQAPVATVIFAGTEEESEVLVLGPCGG